MHSYLIHSLAPLVFRSGKPFTAQASAKDVNFPLPSAGAGLIRSLSIAQGKSNLDKNRCDLKDKDYQALLNIKSCGVYLVRYGDDALATGNVDNVEMLLPKPANSLYIEDETGEMKLIRLAPQAFDEDCGSDLPAGLLYVQTVDKNGQPLTVKGKPKAGANFWTLSDVKRWQQGENLDYETVNANGLPSVPTDTRTHVALDDDSRASDDGKLFQTASYDLGYQACQSDAIAKRGFDDKRLGFVVLSEQELSNDWATFGGERRLSQFLPLTGKCLPKPTQNDVDKINNAGGFSLTFITPVIFNNGYRPAWLNNKLDNKLNNKLNNNEQEQAKQNQTEQAQTIQGKLPNSTLSVQLLAAAIERWQPVSGWDSLLWQPKANRKAVAAGSVYWFKLLEPMNLTTLERLHQSLADNDYDQNDGFGLALVAPYTPFQ